MCACQSPDPRRRGPFGSSWWRQGTAHRRHIYSLVALPSAVLCRHSCHSLWLHHRATSWWWSWLWWWGDGGDDDDDDVGDCCVCSSLSTTARPRAAVRSPGALQALRPCQSRRRLLTPSCMCDNSAAEYGRLHVIEALLARGANIDFQSHVDGQTALMRAAKVGQLPAVRMLCERGANTHIKVCFASHPVSLTASPVSLRTALFFRALS